MSKFIVFFGISDFAKTLYLLSREMDNINVVAFMADDEYCTETSFCGLPVWKYSTLNSSMIEQYNFLICVGYKNMRNRQLIFERLQQRNCQFINLIHRSATILPSVKMGVNNIIFPNVTIETNVHIGNNNVFGTQSVVAHDNEIGDHNFFAPRTTLAGFNTVEDLCFFGVASFAINNLKIKDETFLIAGSGLFTDTKKHGRYWGNPAKMVSLHKETGIIID
jgi:sugar O-acyltransferase (sialic acid O-acetyltransferase NeuD family)